MYDYNAVITNVVDGDTYDVDIDLGFHIHIHERIRVLNLNTPECKGVEKEYGKLCKTYAEKHFLNKNIKLFSEAEIKAPRTDSFGRWLCRI
jgi:micrococcal nuclease